VALADIVGVAREGLLALSAATGISVMQAMFEAEVTAVAGVKGRHDPARTAVRHGTEKGSVTLRPGNAGSNTAADHLTVVDAALMQLPDQWRSKPILIRADGAGYSHALISALSQQGLEFSVGYPVTEAVRDAIALVPKWAWQVASNADGLLREHADVVEVTKMLDLSNWAKTCPDMRVIVRRELPHPGATLDAFEIRDGYRYQAFTTNTPRRATGVPGSPASCARPCRGPDPDRQRHRSRAPSEQAAEHQRSLDRACPDRRGPARPGPVDAPHDRA